ncbi:MAG: hemolysin III family protein [Pirellulaceae bacterium]
MATDSILSEPVQGLSSADELANSLTHGAGLLLSLAGAGVMVSAMQASNTWVQLSAMVYVASLVAVYALSTLSHAVQAMPHKNRLRAWDQGTIYLLIAGSYTPFIAAFVPPGQAAVLTAAMWLAAGFGFWLKVVANHRVIAFSAWSYIALGWFPAVAFVGRIPLACVMWMVLGGVSYTVGTVFLKLDTRVRYFHAIWHILVIIASACHFHAILTYAVA